MCGLTSSSSLEGLKVVSPITSVFFSEPSVAAADVSDSAAVLVPLSVLSFLLPQPYSPRLSVTVRSNAIIFFMFFFMRFSSLFFFLILYNLSLTYYGIHKSLRHKITFAFFQSDVYKTCHSILIRFADIYLIRIFAIQTAAGITAHCPAAYACIRVSENAALLLFFPVLRSFPDT